MKEGAFGWANRIQVWIVIIVVIIIVFLSFMYSNMGSEWYPEGNLPAGAPVPWAFTWIWIALYIGLFFAGMISVWRTKMNPNFMMLIFLTIIIYTFAWIVLYSQDVGSFVPWVVLLIVGMMTLLYIVLSRPSMLHGNHWVNMVPIVVMVAFFLWILTATYLNTGVVAINKLNSVQTSSVEESVF